MDGREKMSFTLKSLYDDPFYQFFLFFYFNWRWHIIFKCGIVDEADTYLKYFTNTPSIFEILTHIWILVLQNETAVLITKFRRSEKYKIFDGKMDRQTDGWTDISSKNQPQVWWGFRIYVKSKVCCYYKYHNLILYIS